MDGVCDESTTKKEQKAVSRQCKEKEEEREGMAETSGDQKLRRRVTEVTKM